MKIGLFSDTYLPSVNGISYVLEITAKRLIELGHEVYIFAPASNLRAHEPEDHPYVYRFPAVEGIFFDEQLTSVFFPPAAYYRIKRLELDIIHCFTPGQIGSMGMLVALKTNVPLINQYSTDYHEYAAKYPQAIPATIALVLSMPWMLRLSPRETIKLLSVLRPQAGITKWQRAMAIRVHVAIHDNCNAVIALSPKMKAKLDSWHSKTPSTLMPNGVNPLPQSKPAVIRKLRRDLGIADEQVVLLYVGRMGKEKNLELTLDAFARVYTSNRNAVLVLVGGFGYREVLATRAERLGVASSVVFVDKIPREQLGDYYAIGDIFVFTSLSDTQGLVVNEAAGAGLPIILCDDALTTIVQHEQSGLVVKPTVRAVSSAMNSLIDNPVQRAAYGITAARLAKQYDEKSQTKKLVRLYQQCIATHRPPDPERVL